MDKIIVKGLRVRGKHGVTMQENTFGQEFEVDLEIMCDLSDICENDDIDASIDRRELVQIVSRVIESVEHCDTPEHLAHKIARAVFDNFARAEEINLELKQLQPPIIGDFDYISVFINGKR